MQPTAPTTPQAPAPGPAPKKKSNEWLGAVLLLAAIVGAVLAWRWLGGGKHGADCTQEEVCSLGHICIENPSGPGSVCAKTCESDGDCDRTRCVPFESRNALTGTTNTHVAGADHVCAID